jgi:REP element-mobilizing transposase RayT
MARPLRIEFPGALYHVCSRGNARQAIYLDDDDRVKWLMLLGEVCRRFNWVCYSYCQMTNHYHLMIETPDGNLSSGMRHLNGVYTQFFNKRHRRVGHLFQGRYASPLIEKEAYLLELCRYIVLNPVRAGIVAVAEEWQWSSYRHALGQNKAEDWLQVDWLLSCFSARKHAAIEKYAKFVSQGRNQSSPWSQLKNQIYLGSDDYVDKVQVWIGKDKSLDEIPAAQKRPVAKPLSFYRDSYPSRSLAMAKAYLSGGYSMREVGQYFGVHYMTVSRAVKRFEGECVL